MNHETRAQNLQSVEVEKKNGFDILADKETRRELKIRMNELIEQIREKKIDSVIFLDRSARPLSWLFLDIWKKLYPKEKHPDIKFMNIGKKSHLHVGSANRITNYSKKEPFYLSEDSRELVEKMDLSSEWLGLSDVPEEWQDAVLDHEDDIEELESIFKDEFKGKQVLVLDDFLATGRTQLSTLALLNAAFPGTTFFGTAMYKSPVQGVELDRQKMPWLSRADLVGILELPESPLVSSRINEQGVEKIRQHLLQSLKYEKDDKFWSNWIKEELQTYNSAENMIKSSAQLRKELRMLALED